MLYKVSYIAKDGSHRYFHVESNHRIVNSNRINIMSNPLLGEILREFQKRNADPKSAMFKHGGSMKLTGIVNESTGVFQPYDLHV